MSAVRDELIVYVREYVSTFRDSVKLSYIAQNFAKRLKGEGISDLRAWLKADGAFRVDMTRTGGYTVCLTGEEPYPLSRLIMEMLKKNGGMMSLVGIKRALAAAKHRADESKSAFDQLLAVGLIALENDDKDVRLLIDPAEVGGIG